MIPGFTQSVFTDKLMVMTYNFNGFHNDAQMVTPDSQRPPFCRQTNKCVRLHLLSF
jgi:hypothetical protein